MLIGECRAEDFVVGQEVFAVDPRFRNTRRTTGLEDIHGLPGEALGHPALNRTAAQPLVLEAAEEVQVTEARDPLTWIPSKRTRALEPERRSCRRIEMPGDDLSHP